MIVTSVFTNMFDAFAYLEELERRDKLVQASIYKNEDGMWEVSSPAIEEETTDE